MKEGVCLILNKLQGEARKAIAFILQGRHEPSASQANMMRSPSSTTFQTHRNPTKYPPYTDVQTTQRTLASS